MKDIVFPHDNEEEFIEIAKKLGIELIFAYTDKEKFSTKTQNAILTTPQKIQNLKHQKIMTICQASREAIERRANIVYGFETLEEKEHTHYRKSGLNQVLCKLATENNVQIGLSVDELLNTTGQKRAILLGRIKQNIKFCEKYKTPIKIASFATNPYNMRSPQEITALFLKLGMQPETIQKALN